MSDTPERSDGFEIPGCEGGSIYASIDEGAAIGWIIVERSDGKRAGIRLTLDEMRRVGLCLLKLAPEVPNRWIEVCR